MNTFSPLCRPTPVARITFLRVRWRSMVGSRTFGGPGEKLARRWLNLNGKAATRRCTDGDIGLNGREWKVVGGARTHRADGRSPRQGR
jgi:hypothetical protein